MAVSNINIHFGGNAEVEKFLICVATTTGFGSGWRCKGKALRDDDAYDYDGTEERLWLSTLKAKRL